MKPYRSHLLRLSSGLVVIGYHDREVWVYEEDASPIVDKIVKAFPIDEAMTFLEDAEWEGKIKSVPLEGE